MCEHLYAHYWEYLTPRHGMYHVDFGVNRSEPVSQTLLQANKREVLNRMQIKLIPATLP